MRETRLATLLGPYMGEDVAEGRYYGACVVNAPGGWTRVGPTWKVRGGWIVVGPGVRAWNTTKGLAELAVEKTAKPDWHAVGATFIENPYLVIPATPEASANSPEVRDLTTAAEAMESKKTKES